MPRSVVLIVNHRKPRAAEALREVRGLIEQHGKLVAQLEADEHEPIPTNGGVDLVIALGGDGTILSAAGRCLQLGCPLLGVNMGKVGFMAGYELESFRAAAPVLLGNGELTTRRVRALHADVVGADGTPRCSAVALNEFVVTAGPPYRMITLDVSVDNAPGPSVSGDGLIVSTPLGSTAYNVSAGGPIVAPGVDASILTPIAAHSLSFRPIVVPASSEIRITIESVNAFEDAGTTLMVDGQVHDRLHEGDIMRVRTGEEIVEFVIDPSVSYWQTLIGKMHWASAPSSPGSRGIPGDR
ncbi:MAG: NAD(+)/NADH kinase [Phycisphaerales bacterium]|nr:NAD(+)/NADH kinase [Phycisphaerales bacterium]